jgi:hypothetical protein
VLNLPLAGASSWVKYMTPLVYSWAACCAAQKLQDKTFNVLSGFKWHLPAPRRHQALDVLIAAQWISAAAATNSTQLSIPYAFISTFQCHMPKPSTHTCMHICPGASHSTAAVWYGAWLHPAPTPSHTTAVAAANERGLSQLANGFCA